jgi:hypothetical protein
MQRRKKNEDLVPLITLENRTQDHWNDTKGNSNMSNKLHKNCQYSIEIKVEKQIGNVPNQQFVHFGIMLRSFQLPFE